MIVVQNLKLEILGTFTTLKGFLKEYDGDGVSLSSYDYIRDKVSKAGMGNKVKYRRIFITRYVVKGGKKSKGVDDVMDDDDFVY